MRFRAPRIGQSLLAVLGEGFFSRLSFGMVDFALPLFAYRLGLDFSAIGFLLSLNLVCEMLLKPFLAPLADRFGPKATLTAGIAVRSLVPVIFAFATSPWQLFAARFVHGASEALRDPSVTAVISVQAQEKLIASSFSWYHTARVTAGALGKAAAGYMLGATLSNFPVVFLISFGISALPLFLVFKYVETGTGESPAGPHAKNVQSGTPVIKAVLPALGFGVLISGTATMLTNLFPLIATKYAGLSEAETGSIYLVSVTAVLFAGPLFGWLSDNFSRRLVLLTRSVANTVSSLLYLIFPDFWGVLVARVADDAGKAAFRPAWGAIMSKIANIDAGRRARTLGYMGVAENFGEAAGPLLGGILWQTWGIAVMLTVRAVLAAGTEVLAARLIRFPAFGNINNEQR